MSNTTEETKLPDVVFNGTNGKECEAFVVAIQEFAFSKGWDEDHQWMLRFAKTRLRGNALRWCARLDLSIKKDWDLFVQALFDQYPSVEAPDDGRVPTPVWSTTNFSPSLSMTTLPANREFEPNSTKQSIQHLQPVRQYDASSAGQQIGLLRIVNEEGTGILSTFGRVTL